MSDKITNKNITDKNITDKKMTDKYSAGGDTAGSRNKDEYTLDHFLEEHVHENLFQMTLSGSRSKEGPSKVKIRPVLLKDTLVYQVTETVGTKVFHANYDRPQVMDYIREAMEKNFRQLQSQGLELDGTVLVSKKGKMDFRNRRHSMMEGARELSHNRTKKYILPEGTPVPFLIDLGVQTQEGRTVAKRYDKFRQINRFLEFIEDILPQLPADRELTILDFGCGKSYLTFAMYYYLRILKNYDVSIIGLDLKKDVIEHCNALAQKYGYEKLRFLEGDIADYEGVDRVDMVVTLHACDTATDYALAKAVRWGARVILSVPCCQHEANGQIRSELLAPVFSYGILKERMAALLTDGIRAKLLEEMGYETQILEFIDMEHTPKNLLIRAVKRGERSHNAALDTMIEELHLSPCLENLLHDKVKEEKATEQKAAEQKAAVAHPLAISCEMREE